MTEFNPVRLQLARERRGILQKDLATRCEVTPTTVYNWESGTTTPGPEHVARIADQLGFPEAFFFRPMLDRLPAGAASFRARTKLPARQKRAALAAGDLSRELAAWIEHRFDLPPVRLPNLKLQPPELAAQVIRAEWLLGDKPIPNLLHLLESRGVLVFSLCQDCRELDAFSFWIGERPIILLNTMKSAERSRVDAAHELFHLVAHDEETGKEEELAADIFAGALLIPDRDIRKHTPQILGLQTLIHLKRRWGVSLAALVYRLHELKMISDWQYRKLFIDLSKRGYRTSEPNPMPRETSAVLAKVFEVLRAQGLALRRVAGELAWHPQDLKEFIFGLGAGLFALDGDGGGAGSGRRDHLRLA